MTSKCPNKNGYNNIYNKPNPKKLKLNNRVHPYHNKIKRMNKIKPMINNKPNNSKK